MTEEEKQIYQEYEERFKEAVSKDKRIQDLAEKLANGTATYKDAWEYANKVGHAGSRALIEQADQLIAEDIDGYETIMDALYDCYDQSATYAAAVQTLENQKAGLGIKGAQANFDRSRASGIAHLGSNAEDAESAAKVLGIPVEHFTENVVGDTIKANEEFQYRSGLNPKIKRTSSGKCCQWCDEIAGVYDYPAPDEVYRRHQNCNCLVEYYPGNGLKQNVHTKRWVDENRTKAQSRIEFSSRGANEGDSVEAGRLARQKRQQEEHDSLMNMLRNSIVMGTPYVEPELIKNQGFSHKFNQLTPNTRVNNILRALAQGNITRNNGTYTETLDIINLDTGEKIIHKRGKKNALEVRLSGGELKTIKEYKGRKVALHNHPTNIYPTGSDFVTAAAREYDFGVVITHDLRVFVYTPPKQMVDIMSIDAIIDKNVKMKYTDIERNEGFISAMKELERRFGITWQEIM